MYLKIIYLKMAITLRHRIIRNWIRCGGEIWLGVFVCTYMEDCQGMIHSQIKKYIYSSKQTSSQNVHFMSCFFSFDRPRFTCGPPPRPRGGPRGYHERRWWPYTSALPSLRGQGVWLSLWRHHMWSMQGEQSSKVKQVLNERLCWYLLIEVLTKH